MITINNAQKYYSYIEDIHVLTIVLFFSSKDCASCKLANKDLCKNDLYRNDFPILKINLDYPENTLLANKFNIKNLPTFVKLFRFNGKYIIVKTIEEYSNKEQLFKNLELRNDKDTPITF